MHTQKSLFSTNDTQPQLPLAEKVRPRDLTEVMGQEKLLAPDSQLQRMVREDDYSSFILWGPPGTGKTTIARIVQQHTRHHFVAYSAVLSGIKEIKQVMQQADFLFTNEQKKTILFIDEIHRFNKSQQDAFLYHLETGSVILIGATTENPSFEINAALLSRCHVFVLQALDPVHVRQILEQGLQRAQLTIKLPQEVMELLCELSGGDARKALNFLEAIARHFKDRPVTREHVAGLLNKGYLSYDKQGDGHFNAISALHKSLRGSDPQAGLYWLARMLESGEDPLYIVRRLIRFASEDVGLADPQALIQAVAVKEAVHFIGLPEASNALAQLVVYLATAPKSNALYVAYQAVAADARKTSHLPVPLHICNAPTQLMKDLNYSKGYQYDHDYESNYAYQKYFPDNLPEKIYYTPSSFGFEKEIRKRLDWWLKLRKKQES